MDATRVEAGAVVSVNPGRRELRIRPLPAYQHAFETLEWLRVVPPGSAELRCRVRASRTAGDTVVVTLDAGVTRAHVAAMRGGRVLFALEECAPGPDGQWELAGLVGMRVANRDGEPAGVVVEVFETPANAAFAVERADGSRFLLPAIPEVVELVDLDSNTVHLGPTGPYVVEE